jgi:hypothetical protein
VSPTAKLAGFAAALTVAFGGAALAGAAIDPDREEPPVPAHRSEDEDMPSTTHTTSPARATAGHGEAHPVRGLAVAENGLRLVIQTPELRRGAAQTLRFRIVDRRGAVVRDFDVEHEKRMHLIVARRDLAGFQHLHPEQAADGSWSAPLRLEDAGSHRVFADFARDDESFTLAGDLRVDGAADLRALPAPAGIAVTDTGYDVRLDAGHARPGRQADLRFTITKDGHTVHTEPYLGAGGHLVALREGDLAFLHVHPTEHGHGDEQPEGEDAHDDSIGFAATFPTAGRYRLFLQFKHDGRVHTAAFTREVA